ncbi:ANTAR domain-containing protein [Streptomyces sp. NPDC096046]|uniref:ANTAR domain-containing protein n=1 Tax=Streptomyces sp. NPDC096046 TaxID=3155542 RepID=UPI00333432BF
MDRPHNSHTETAEVRRPAKPDDSATKIEILERDNDHLQAAITSHAVIDQAIGVIIALGGLRPQQGFDVLKEISQHTNIKLRTIADHVVDWVSSERMPDDVQQALNTALRRARCS